MTAKIYQRNHYIYYDGGVTLLVCANADMPFNIEYTREAQAGSDISDVTFIVDMFFEGEQVISSKLVGEMIEVVTQHHRVDLGA